MTKVFYKMKILMAGCFALSGMCFILTSFNIGFLSLIPDWPFWYLGLFSTLMLFSLFAAYGLMTLLSLKPARANTYQLHRPAYEADGVEPSAAWPGNQRAAA